MAGHSKWANIKHRKGAQDAKRSKIFTKLIKEIAVAARMGGGDIDTNPRLRSALQSARAANMPNQNITRAIKRGTGELEGVNYEEITFEGYGPKGVAVMVKCLTDNRNRTLADVRFIFTKHNGNLGENGCVSWIFRRKGIVTLLEDQIGETELMDLVLDFNVDDISVEGGCYTITTDPDAIENVRNALIEKSLAIQESKVSFVPENQIMLSGDDAKMIVKMLSLFEDNEDVQDVVSNFDIDDSELEAIVSEI